MRREQIANDMTARALLVLVSEVAKLANTAERVRLVVAGMAVASGINPPEPPSPN